MDLLDWSIYGNGSKLTVKLKKINLKTEKGYVPSATFRQDADTPRMLSSVYTFNRI